MTAARLRRLLLIAALAIVVLPLVGIAGLCSGGFWFGVSQQTLDDELARVRARGEPASVEDLGWPGAEPPATGTVSLEEVWRASGPARSDWPQLDDLSVSGLRAAPAEMQAQVREFVASNEPLVEGLRALAGRPECRFGGPPPIDDVQESSRGWRLLHATRLLRLARVSAWVDGDVRRVLDLHRVQAQLASRLGHDMAGFEAVAVAEALVGTLAASSEILMRHPTITIAEVRHAIEPALRLDPDALFREALRAERAIWLTCVDNSVNGGPVPSGIEIPSGLPWSSRSARAGALAWSRAVDHVLATPPGQYAEMARRIAAWDGRPNSYWVATFDQGEAWHGLARIAPPYLARSVTRLVATQRICRVSLACVAHFRETGAWPASLDDVDDQISPVDRIDPFTERSLRFDRVTDGVRVSSLGCIDVVVWGTKFVGENDPEADGLVWTLRR